MFPAKLPGEDYIYSWYTILIALSVGMVFGFRNYMKGPPCPSREKLTKKVAIVTGANRGIGKEIARDFAERGARVILACRNEEAGKEAAEDIIATSGNKKVSALKLDLASFESIRNFASVINSKRHGLHILVNNAGIMSQPQGETEDGHEMHFGVNYLGHFLLTQLLLPKMKASGGSRILNVTALAYQIAEPDLDDLKFSNREYKAGDAYADSKLYILCWTRHMAKLLERIPNNKVTVNVYQPGVCNTELYKMMPFYNNTFIRWSFAPLMFILMKGARDGAQTPIYLAVSKEEEGVSGKFYADCRMKEPEELACDEEKSAQLWDISMRLCGLEDANESEES